MFTLLWYLFILLCCRCLQVGHMVRDCPLPCNACGQAGHSFAACPNYAATQEYHDAHGVAPADAPTASRAASKKKQAPPQPPPATDAIYQCPRCVRNLLRLFESKTKPEIEGI